MHRLKDEEIVIQKEKRVSLSIPNKMNLGNESLTIQTTFFGKTLQVIMN